MGNSLRLPLASTQTDGHINRFGNATKSRQCFAAYINKHESEKQEDTVIIAYEDSLEIWNYTSGDRIQRLLFDYRKVTCAMYSTRSSLGKIVALGFFDGSIEIYSADLATIRKTYTLAINANSIGNESRVDCNDVELKNFSTSSSPRSSEYIHPTALCLCKDQFLHVGDSVGRVHVFNLILVDGKAISIHPRPEEISRVVGIVGDGDDGRISKDEFSFSAAFATVNGTVTVFSMESADQIPLLVLKTDPNLIYIKHMILSSRRYILTVYAGGQQGWIIDSDTGESTVMNFEAELTARRIVCHPITAAFYCNVSKLLFVGDMIGTVFVREVIVRDSGIGMRLAKRAEPQGDRLRVTWMHFDPFLGTLLVGDTSGVVRSIENIGPSTGDASGSLSTATSLCREEEPSFHDISNNRPDQRIILTDVTSSGTVYDDSESYQDGDDIIRL